MTKIEQLENELNQKTDELNNSLNSQRLLRETLKKSTKAMEEIEDELKVIEIFLKYSNAYVHKLMQENATLKSSCDGWTRRAISLEFKLLSARDATKE